MPKDQPKENDKDLYEGTPHKKKFFPRIALIPGGGGLGDLPNLN